MTRDPDTGLRVRPYAITKGRTRSDTDIPIETILIRTPAGRAQVNRSSMERGRILRLLEGPMSLAEISAHLGVPIGVARVIAGDMAGDGLVDFSSSQSEGERPSLRLLERVYDGLQAL